MSVVLCVVLMGLGFAGCGDAKDGDDSGKVEPRMRSTALRPVQWKNYGPPAGRRIDIISEVGYCAGPERPRIADVRVVERAKKVFLTAILATPEFDGTEGCAGVGIGVRKRVDLNRPVGKRYLFDASVKPPKQRWPLP